MLLTRNMIFAIFIASLLALSISYIPTISMNKEIKTAPVFKQAQPVILDKKNLVDIISMLQTHVSPTHVNWQNNNLFLDYKVDAAKPIYVDDIYEDLYDSLQAAYFLTSNVQGLYVRVIYNEKGKNEVLIALSAERTKDLLMGMEQISSIEEKKGFLNEFTTLSYGVLWKEKIQK
ncbi:MAG TPA: hypothetical protein VJ824_12620 [Bacillota bacterium]|nr:hypothetical protein [Bacillota bacterium]